MNICLPLIPHVLPALNGWIGPGWGFIQRVFVGPPYLVFALAIVYVVYVLKNYFNTFE